MRLDRDKLNTTRKALKYSKSRSKKAFRNREALNPLGSSTHSSGPEPKKSQRHAKSKTLISITLLFLILGIFVLSFGFIFSRSSTFLAFLKGISSPTQLTAKIDKEITIDKGFESRISRVISTPDGFVGIGSTIDDESEKYQILLTKVDDDGNIVWVKTFGAENDDFGYDIVQIDEGFFALGTTSSKSLGTRGRYDVLLLRLDKNGNTIWQKTYGGPDWDRAYRMVRAGNNFVFVGDNYAKGNDVTANFGEHDYWTVMFSSDGKIIWDRSFGGTRWDRAYAVGYDPMKGQILVAGSSNSFTDGTRYDGYVVSYNSAGQLIWQTVLTNSHTLWPMDLSITEKAIFVSGYVYENFNDANSERLGTERAFIAKLTINGQVEYIKTFGENVRIHSVLNSLQSEGQNGIDMLYFAGYKYDGEKKLPWYGLFEYDKSSGKLQVVEKTIDTDYGMLFSISYDEKRNVFVLSGTIMKDGKMKGLIKLLSNIES